MGPMEMIPAAADGITPRKPDPSPSRRATCEDLKKRFSRTIKTNPVIRANRMVLRTFGEALRARTVLSRTADLRLEDQRIGLSMGSWIPGRF
jgi:hypothetical protein